MKTENKKCYSCAYKSDVPGSAHSRCNYDWSNSIIRPPAADDHGIKNRWYIFPINFDPVWQIEECAAHATEKDLTKMAKSDPASDLLSILGRRAFR